jgi:hypothetical protein
MRNAASALAAALSLAATHLACAGAPDIVLRAGAFERSALHPAGAEARVRAQAHLGTAPGVECCTLGWVEYDFRVPESGWYELLSLPVGREIEYSIRSQGMPADSAPFRIYDSTGNVVRGEDKVSNVWLDAGPHTLRVKRMYWTGFPPTQAFVLRPAGTGTQLRVRAWLAGATNVFRTRGCAPIEIEAGPASGELVVLMRRALGGPATQVAKLELRPSARPLRTQIEAPCDREGDYLISFASEAGELSWRDQRAISYEAIDVAAVPRGGASRRVLVDEIDLAARAPDYASGATRVVPGASGAYRESADVGFTRYERLPPAARAMLSSPSWFAYTLKSVRPEQPHVVEVDYPDDALRSFAIALRESEPLAYPVAAGVDSGGEFSLSGGMQTHALLYWPRAPETRVVFLNTHDGRRAAAARVRLYRLDGQLPPLEARSGGRRFINYFEEGSNFLSLYGARDAARPAAKREALERWAEAARYMGVDTLMPTVSVYSFVLYPSRLQPAFSKPDADDLRRILLVAEKHGLQVIPELHPRADDLTREYALDSDSQAQLLVSRQGRTNFYAADGKTRNVPPLFDAIHPRSRRWYLAVIEELAHRYADSPAFVGVSLRQMPWANPAFNNFQSLDWGYGEASLAAFEKDTGLRVPRQHPYDWLMEHARELWIDWRTRQIARVYADALARLHAVRKDLLLVSPLFRWGAPEGERLGYRYAGVEPALLARLPGVVLLHAQATYGRREADPIATQLDRDLLLDPASLGWMSAAGAAPGFLTIAHYVELTDAIAPPESLGFAAGTRRTWASAAVTPAGRHFLERYAVQLAETDALALGDGGNGYSLGQPLLRDWMREYRSLPAKRFTPREDARDPVALWTLDDDSEGLLAYAVNRERYPATIEIGFDGPGDWRRLAGGDHLDSAAGKLFLALQPYELVALRAARGTRIRGVVTRPPRAALEQLQAQVRAVENLLDSPRYALARSLLGHELRAALKKAAKESREALDRGHLWHARTLLEHHTLLSVYERLGCQPPRLREVDGAEDCAP